MLSTKDPAFRRQAGLVALEAFLIVLGVGLAYLSTAWYEQRKERAEARQALASIVAEIHENREAARSSIEYHTSIQAVLIGALRSGEVPNRSSFPRGYVGPAELVSIAWDLANARGSISSLPYADVLEVGRLYADQGEYLATTRQVGGLIYGVIFDEGSDRILERAPNLLEIVMSFLYRECQLADHQDRVLAFLGSLDQGEGAGRPEACERILGPRTRS